MSRKKRCSNLILKHNRLISAIHESDNIDADYVPQYILALDAKTDLAVLEEMNSMLEAILQIDIPILDSSQNGYYREVNLMNVNFHISQYFAILHRAGNYVWLCDD